MEFNLKFLGFETDIKLRVKKLSSFSILAEIESATLIIFGSLTLSQKDIEDTAFKRLRVSFTEKFYAAGLLPRNKSKRELYATDFEILVSRYVDRAIRSTFPYMPFDCSIDLFTKSLDCKAQCIDDTRVLATNLASILVGLMSKVWQQSYSLVITKKLIMYLNGVQAVDIVATTSTHTDLYVTLSEEGITALDIEARFKTLPADLIKRLNSIFNSLQSNFSALNELLEQIVAKYGLLNKMTTRKIQLEAQVIANKLKQLVVSHFSFVNFSAQNVLSQLDIAIEDCNDKQVFMIETLKQGYLEYTASKNLRPDGRRFDEIRPISVEVNQELFAHGYGKFKRGGTVVESYITITAQKDPIVSESILFEPKKHFLTHYTFNGFAAEEKQKKGISRREVGHAFIIESSIQEIYQENPQFFIRNSCEVLESDGSTSMASVCASSVAMLTAGLKCSQIVAGISLGCVGNNVLVDLCFLEDMVSDMDLKVSCNQNGEIKFIHLDTKNPVSLHLIATALEIACKKCVEIIDVHLYPLRAKQFSLKGSIEKEEVIIIDSEDAKKIIGLKGKNIKKMSEDFHVEINIQPLNARSSTVAIVGNMENIKKAKIHILDILQSR